MHAGTGYHVILKQVVTICDIDYRSLILAQNWRLMKQNWHVKLMLKLTILIYLINNNINT